MKFAAVLVWLLAALTLAHAGWGTARWAHLGDDKFLILKGSTRFVLARNVTWDLQDPSQKRPFEAWRTSAGLPPDLGELVENAPTDRQASVAGWLKLANESDAGAENLLLAIGGNGMVPLRLSPSADGYFLNSDDEMGFDAFAKSLGMKPSALLIALSGSGGSVSAGSAWAGVVKRLKSGHDFYSVVQSGTKIIFGRGYVPPTPGSAPKRLAGPKSKPPASPAPAPFPWLLVGAVGGVVVAGGAGFGVYRAFNNPKGRSLRPISAHESELLEMVRQEAASGKWKKATDSEGFVVGRMMDAFRKLDGLQKQVQSLSEFQKFQAQHADYEKRLEGLTGEIAAKTKELQKLHALMDENKRLKAEAQGLSATVGEANKLIDELTAWCQELSTAIGDIAK